MNVLDLRLNSYRNKLINIFVFDYKIENNFNKFIDVF